MGDLCAFLQMPLNPGRETGDIALNPLNGKTVAGVAIVFAHVFSEMPADDGQAVQLRFSKVN
jgi:hypothetical protein